MCTQYCMSTADWINMLNMNSKVQIMQISIIMLFPGPLTTSHLSVLGVKAVSKQDASHTHPKLFSLSDPIVWSGPTRDWRYCALLLNLRNLPVTGYSPKDKPLSLLCYSSDRGTRGYFQGNLVSVITWCWSGFTSVDGGCQHLFDAWLSLRNTSELIKVINWRQNTC